MFGMNAVVAVTITFLHPSGQPSTQRIWVVTCDLSANGVMPRHQFSTKEPVKGSNWRAATHLGAATFAQELVMKL